MYKLVDATANEPQWYSGTVNYPLLKGVRFRYRNIISAVKYLLRQKAYAADMVWGPQQHQEKKICVLTHDLLSAASGASGAS
jgi:hypothetical protein